MLPIGRLAEKSSSGGEFDIKDVEAIERLKRQLENTRPDTPEWFNQASNVALALLSRYEQTNETGYREDFVQTTDNILAATGATYEQRLVKAKWLHDWALRLQACYRRRAGLKDIMLAIQYHEQGLQITPDDRFELLTTTRVVAATCYIDQTSTTEDDDALKRAMELLNEALNSSQKCSQAMRASIRIIILWAKSDLLALRYGREKALENLDAALEHLKSAWVSLSDPIDRTLLSRVSENDRIDILSKLTWLHDERSNRSESEERQAYKALSEKYADELLTTIRKSTHPDPLVHDWIFVGILQQLSDQSRERITQGDIEQATKRFEAALEQIPDDDSRKFMYLGAYAEQVWENSLGWSSVGGRRRQASVQDLERRDQAIQKCLRLLPKGILDYKSQLLVSFGHIYIDQIVKNQVSEADLGPALDLFRDASVCEDARPSVRIQGARVAATILVYKKDWIQAADMFETAIGLIRSLSPASLSPSDQQFVLKAISGLSSEAAATALQAGRSKHRALSLLELGRGVIARLRMRTRGGLGRDEDLFDARPHSGAPPDLVSSTLKDSCGRNNEMLTREVMKVIGDEAVVVINVSKHRSDAFLITKSGLSLVELPQMQQSKLERAVLFHKTHRPRIWVSTLSLLWFFVAKPILDSTGFAHYVPLVPSRPRRVCWILTGALSALPIHAAGCYRNPGTTVMDRVVSSYSSSLTAFIDRKARQEDQTHPRRALLVGVSKPSLHALGELRYVSKEIAVLRALCDLPRFDLSSIELGKNVEEDILSALRKGDVTVFHFAGHGLLHPSDPSKSGLLLQDGGVLTVAKLRDSELDLAHRTPPFLAYLSACSTGANEAKVLMDEGIHLIGACQLIGFRHVIGTMWQASDSRCVVIAKKVYETIAERGWTDDAVAEALHEALLKARANWVMEVLHPAMFSMAWQVVQTNSSFSRNHGEAILIELGSYTRLMNSEELSAAEVKMPTTAFPDDQAHGAKDSNRDERNVRRDRIAEEYELGTRPEDVVVRADWIPFVHYGP